MLRDVVSQNFIYISKVLSAAWLGCPDDEGSKHSETSVRFCGTTQRSIPEKKVTIMQNISFTLNVFNRLELYFKTIYFNNKLCKYKSVT
jgi:hypothetical protein